MRARVALSVGGLLAVAGALNFVLVNAVAPGFGVHALVVNLAAGVAATLLTVWLTARYESGIRRIASGLAEIARGRRDVRFDVDREPLVSNLAHCANDAIAALADPVDPGVGQLRVRKRTGEVRVARPEDDLAVTANIRAPSPQSSARLTPVPEPAPAPAPVAAPSPPPSRPADPPSARLTPVPPPAEPPLPEPGPPIKVEAVRGPATAVRSLSTPPIMAPAAEPVTPPNGSSKKEHISDALVRQEHFKTVFEEYRASLIRLGGLDEELTLGAFMETLAETEKALVDRHGCRAVRFSVLVEEGKVQLLPRLVR